MSDEDDGRLDRMYKTWAAITVAVPFVMTLAYGIAAAPTGGGVRAAFAAGLAALSALSVGGFIGFLFGIPKTLSAPQEPDEPTSSSSEPRTRNWRPNTNLEQISDWLTKILLGIGLTQLTSLPREVQDTGAFVADAIGPGAAPLVGSAILVVFALAGFVIGNLITRFDLGKAIDREETAIQKLTAAAVAAPTDRKTVEALVIASLYADPPTGFEQAIKASESFLAHASGLEPNDRAAFHGYLACAYAQKYTYERARGGKELAAIRDHVLEHVKQAVELNPLMKAYFKQLANPPVGSGEDDLEAFKDDPELKGLWS